MASSYFIDENGDVREVTPEQAPSWMAAGFQPADPDQVRQTQLEDQYGGNVSALGAFGESAARALTFGGSTWLEKALGVDPEGIQAREALHPWASSAGTAAGIIAPLVLSAGAATPEELAFRAAQKAGNEALGLGASEEVADTLASAARTSPMTRFRQASTYSAPAILSRAGQGVSKAIADALPEATGLLAQTGSRALAGAGGAAVEGALFSGGNQFSRAATDPTFSAESAILNVGLDSILAAGIGGGMGAGGSLLENLAGRVTTKDVVAKIRGWEAERNTKTAGAIQNDIVKTENRVGEEGLEKIALAGRDMDLVRMNSTPRWTLKQSRQLQDIAGNEIRSYLTEVDEDAVVKPAIPQLFGTIREKVLDPLVQAPVRSSEAMKLSTLLDEYEAKFNAGASWSDLHNFETTMRKEGKINSSALNPASNPMGKAYLDTARVVSRYIDQGMAKAALPITPWKEANWRYQVASTFATWAKRGVQRGAGNNLISPTETLGFLTGLVSHGVTGGLATGLTTMALRRYGSGVAGATLRGLGDLLDEAGPYAAQGFRESSTTNKGAALFGLGSEAAQPETVGAKQALAENAAAQSQKLKALADKIVNGTLPITARSLAIGGASKVREEQNAVNALANNPDRQMNWVQAHIDDLQEHDPNTAVATATTLSNAVSYLSGQTPPPGQTSIFDNKPPPMSRDQELHWSQINAIANDPVGTLASGQISPETVAALEALWPGHAKGLRSEILSAIAERPGSIPLAARQIISTVMAQDLNNQATVLSANQAVLAASMKQQHTAAQGLGLGKPRGSAKALKSTPIRYETTIQKIANRGLGAK